MIDARTSAAVMRKFDILHVHFTLHLVRECALESALVTRPLFLAYAVAVIFFWLLVMIEVQQFET